MPASFLYFVPRNSTVPIQSVDQLKEADLSYILPLNKGMVSVHTLSGPGAQGGALVTIDGSTPKYDAEKQIWRKGLNGKYWVGYWNDKKPTPDDLLREKSLSGQSVTLLDENDWTIPVCVPNIFGSEGNGITLPQEYDLDDNGTLIARTHRMYAPLAERCYKQFQDYMGWVEEGEAKPDAHQQFLERVDLACDLLAVNYRVSKVEIIGLLGLLGSEAYAKVLRAAIEADAIDGSLEEMGKKMLASGDSDTSDGSTGGESAPSNDSAISK